MLRGINQTQLFYDDEDRIAFMDRLKRYRDECGFSLYAYCLMGNHVHILLNENEWELSLIIKCICQLKNSPQTRFNLGPLNP
jgi:REP element-mobilizing transposase RayT